MSLALYQFTSNEESEEKINLYVESVLLQLPASDKRLEEISVTQKEDPVCKKLLEYCEEGWPNIYKLSSALSPYWSSRSEISVVRGLLLKGSRLIIPSCMGLEILDRIHEGHQGIANEESRTQSGGLD